jgi:uncharacterized protein (DUF1501 family)
MGASRRDFLKNSGLMVMAGAGFLTAEQWLRGADMDSDFRKRFQGREGDAGTPAGVSPRSVKDAGGPKDARLESPTIVTIFLRGGADALNAIVPYGDDAYYQARPRIAIPLQPKNGKAVLKLDKKIGNDYFGLNPHLDMLKPLIEEGDCVPVVNVGSPDGTRSHFSAQDYMERGAPGNPRVTTGWLNRYLQLTRKQTDAPLRGLCAETLLPRALRGPYPVLAGGNRCDEFGLFEDLYAPNNLINQTAREGANMEHGSRLDSLNPDDPGKPKQITSDSVRDVISESGTNAVARIKALEAAMATQSSGDYPGGGLANQLRTIAQVIKANVGLEVAQADYGGWDHHSDQGDVDGRHSRMLKYLGDCLAAFHNDIGARMSKTIVLVMSEFGRTVAENGAMGTDHGRAGFMLAVSKSLNGGRIYGTWNSMADLDEGRFQPVHTDFRAVMAESVMKLFNIDPIKAATIFPGYKPAAKDYLNFMKAVKTA